LLKLPDAEPLTVSNESASAHSRLRASIPFLAAAASNLQLADLQSQSKQERTE